MADEEQNEPTETEASEETVSAPEGPVAPAPDTAEPEPPRTEEEQVEDPAAEPPVRDSGPVEGDSGEPGGFPAGDASN